MHSKTLRAIFTVALVGATACGSDESAEPPAQGSESDALLACESEMFQEVRALSGPGLDPDQGLVGEPLESYIVHSTQIVPRPEKQDEFLAQSGAIFGQLADTEGLIAYSVGLDEECGDARTMGVWASEEAMYAFVTSGAHVEAMAKTTELSVARRVVHWEVTPEEVLALDWETAKARIAEVDGSP